MRDPLKCDEARKPNGDEPQLIVSTTQGRQGYVRSISIRTVELNCTSAEAALSSRFGQPSSSNPEMVEWRPSPQYFLLLTRYKGDDCWLNYVLASSHTAK